MPRRTAEQQKILGPRTLWIRVTHGQLRDLARGVPAVVSPAQAGNPVVFGTSGGNRFKRKGHSLAGPRHVNKKIGTPFFEVRRTWLAEDTDPERPDSE